MDYRENVKVALEGLADHKFRSFLTMLGIIFGVASVIAMLSIGEGAKREAIAKYQDLGVNNIIVREKNMTDEELNEVRAKFSPGLSLRDAEVIREIVPEVSSIASQAEITADVRFANRSVRSSIIGVTHEFYDILNYTIERGNFFSKMHHDTKQKVCVLGAGIARQLFQKEEAVGQMIKIEDQWLEVVGVLESKAIFT
ncbi:MAG: ABC transporter permease, partial [Bacteroidaceae bacterium]|nr:ABC transporter permease [Bacteroidaceae bacterium]